jgi:hypothetical protein
MRKLAWLSAARMECAGRAQRRRRFGVRSPARLANFHHFPRESGVALRLPPHSKGLWKGGSLSVIRAALVRADSVCKSLETTLSRGRRIVE